MEKQAMEKYLIQVAYGGAPLLIKREDEGSFQSTRIRFYRTRAELIKKMPDLFSKVEISIKTIGDSKFLVVSKATSTPVYRLIDGKIVQEEEEKDYKRIITLMARDDASPEEMQEVIKDLPDEQQRELSQLFFDLMAGED